MTPLILLHGALGSATQFDALKPLLTPGRPLYIPDFPGHGGSPADAPFTMARFTDFLIDLMDREGLAQADVFGYSMGGYVALHAAALFPEKIRRIYTLGTKFDWSPETAARETGMLNPEKIAAKVPAFAQALEARHAPADWKQVLARTADMMTDLGFGTGRLSSETLAAIACPVTVGLGEHDNMVSEAESRAAAENLPAGRFDILPGCKHPIEQVDVVLLAARLQDFFSEV
jgi:pimeloyl-ACP methyl ester carboxylesterase